MIEPVKVIAPIARPSDISIEAGRMDVDRPRRCRRPAAHRARRRPPARRRGRRASGTWRRAAASPSSGWCARARRRSRRRWRRRRSPATTPRPLDGGLSASVVSDGDRHADHAEAVALARRRRRRQAAQGEDEQDAGDEIEEGGEIGVHGSSALLLVHREHALGDEEAAEDVHRGEDQRDEADDAREASSRCRPRRRRPTAARRRR